MRRKQWKRPGELSGFFFSGNFKLIIKNMINDVFIKLGLAKTYERGERVELTDGQSEIG